MASRTFTPRVYQFSFHRSTACERVWDTCENSQNWNPNSSPSCSALRAGSVPNLCLSRPPAREGFRSRLGVGGTSIRSCFLRRIFAISGCGACLVRDIYCRSVALLRLGKAVQTVDWPSQRAAHGHLGNSYAREASNSDSGSSTSAGSPSACHLEYSSAENERRSTQPSNKIRRLDVGSEPSFAARSTAKASEPALVLTNND